MRPHPGETSDTHRPWLPPKMGGCRLWALRFRCRYVAGRTTQQRGTPPSTLISVKPTSRMIQARRAQPIRTVKHPSTMTPPCAVLSPSRAAGWPPISTVGEPATIESGGPTHMAISPKRAAGSPPINTVGAPGAETGPPTWGTIPVTMGQVCRSVSRAAGCTRVSFARL